MTNKSRALTIKDADTTPRKAQKAIVAPKVSSDRSDVYLSADMRSFIDLKEMKKAFKVEAYFARAVRKYIERFLRNDFTFVGINPESVSYIRKRFQQMEDVRATAFNDLIAQIAFSLFVYGNAFVLKVREVASSGGREYTDPVGTVRSPVAGYFILDPVYVTPELSEVGTVKSWLYGPPGYEARRIAPHNIMHIKDCAMPGAIMGTPFAYQSLNDIKALRRMEELVEIVSFQEGIPLYFYTIGNKDSKNVNQEDLISMSVEVSNMIQSGAIVAPWTHNIEVKGSQGKALDVSNYLQYFKQRLFSGLGLSALDFGEGDTANKGTASTISEAVIHTVKYYQKLVIDAWNREIKDLLREGNWDKIDDDNAVLVYTAEIDIDSKIKQELHSMALYQSNMLPRGRSLSRIGEDQISEDEEQDMYVSRVSKVLEQYKTESKIEQAEAKTGNNTTKNVVRSSTAKNTKTTQKLAPKNQYGKKTGPGGKQNDMYEIASKVFDANNTIDAIIEELLDQFVFASHMIADENRQVISIKNSEKDFLKRHFTTILTSIRNKINRTYENDMEKSIDYLEQSDYLRNAMDLVSTRVEEFAQAKSLKIKENLFDGELSNESLNSIFLVESNKLEVVT